MTTFFQLRFKQPLFMLMLVFLLPVVSMAQKTINGKVVSDENQQPLPGASVTLKKNGKTAITDQSGQFSISAAEKEIIIISNVGFSTIEIAAGEAGLVVLKPDSKSMNEVVVTALGVKKESKKIGYTTQEIKGADLVKAREPNAVSSFKGKVAGLTVNITPELLRAPSINFRGDGTVLFVVDGVPIKSDTWNISPDDIESYTFLKGQTAGSLYGSLAQNGAIIINTKKGTKDKRGVQLNSTPAPCLKKDFFLFPVTRISMVPVHRANTLLKMVWAAD